MPLEPYVQNATSGNKFLVIQKNNQTIKYRVFVHIREIIFTEYFNCNKTVGW